MMGSLVAGKDYASKEKGHQETPFMIGGGMWLKGDTHGLSSVEDAGRASAMGKSESIGVSGCMDSVENSGSWHDQEGIAADGLAW
jgi:hypothetical protein